MLQQLHFTSDRNKREDMDNAKQHWKILRKLGNDLANKVRSFMVVGWGGQGVLVATEDGQGFWFGTLDFKLMGNPRTVNKPTSLNVPGLVQMAQANYHILLLNKRGEIYSMGANNSGQFELGTVEEETQFLPQLISIPDTKFISVRCGQSHSVALTDDGKVWAWGENNNGQVGVPNSINTNFLQSPRQIPELDPHRVVSVECGSVHSLALTDRGEVYGWGCNNYGQLGDGGSERSQHTPTLIPTLSPVKSIAAGLFHTLLLTRIGEVYVCGRNESGQLGSDVRSRSTTQSSANLSKVAGLPTISQIESHYLTGLSIAMSSDQRCFVWGELRNQKSTCIPQELPSFYSYFVESPLSFYSYYRSTPHSVIVPETPPSVSNRMSRMFDNSETSDVQFVVEQRTIYAHRCILSNSSDYFARMFSETWLPQVDPEDPIVKVTIPDHSYRVFHTFLCLIYTDSLEVPNDLLPELFDLSTQYLVPDLQKLCLSRMRTTLSPTTSCLYYPLTARHSLPELSTFQQDLVQFISTRTSEVYLTPAYQSMDGQLCKQLAISMASLPPNHFS